MAMSQSTLETELGNLDPVSAEAAAITALVDAYGVFAADAATLTTQVALSAAGLAAGKAAMGPLLVGMSAPGAGLAKIPAAVVGFWAAVALGLAASFPGAIAITPPPHAATAAAFATVCGTNVTDNKNKADSLAAIAAVFYTGAITGGTVTFAGPVVEPIV